jgi:paraquat-inducible protein A
VSSQQGSGWARVQRAKLYRLVELIGYWSMLDVFVVALLTALVRFSVLSLVEPLPGVIFFGLTVVLTMLASMSFDPRLIWDGKDTDD